MCPSRRVCTVALLIGTLAASAFAQRSGLGIKAGPLASDLRSANYRSNILPGAVAGIYAPLNMGPRLEVQPELLAAAMGAQQQRGDAGLTTTRLLYVQAPVSAKFYLGNNFNLLGGVQCGWRVLAKRIAPEGTTDVSSDIARFDLGINLGVGLDTRSGFDMGLRFYGGLTDVLEENETFFPRNRSVQLTVGYRLLAFKDFITVRRRP